jgi:hypothetical protein
MYCCTGQFATGPCPSRANGKAALVDAYVERAVLEAFQAEGGLLAQAVSASERIEAAARAVKDAEHELDLFVNNVTLLGILGEQRFVEGAETRQRALNEARDTLARLRQRSTLATEIADGDVVRAWPALTVQEKRRLLHGLLDRVVITRADKRGRHASPIGERTQIVLRGNVLLGENPDDSVKAAQDVDSKNEQR